MGFKILRSWAGNTGEISFTPPGSFGKKDNGVDVVKGPVQVCLMFDGSRMIPALTGITASLILRSITTKGLWLCLNRGDFRGIWRRPAEAWGGKHEIQREIQALCTIAGDRRTGRRLQPESAGEG